VLRELQKLLPRACVCRSKLPQMCVYVSSMVLRISSLVRVVGVEHAGPVKLQLRCNFSQASVLCRAHAGLTASVDCHRSVLRAKISIALCQRCSASL